MLFVSFFVRGACNTYKKLLRVMNTEFLHTEFFLTIRLLKFISFCNIYINFEKITKV